MIRDAAALVSGTVVAQAVAVISSIILAKLYTPEHFGVLAFFMSLIVAAGPFSSGKYEQALVLAKDPTEMVNLFSLTFILLTGTSLIALALVIFAQDNFAQMSNLAGVEAFIPFVPLGIFLAGTSRILAELCTRERRFKSIASGEISRSLTAAIYQVASGIISASSAGLIAGTLLSQVFQVFVLARGVVRRQLLLIRGGAVRFATLTAVGRSYSDFPKYVLSRDALVASGEAAPPLLLAILFDPAIAGFYFLSTRVLRLPILLIGQSVRQAYYRHAAALREEERSLFPSLLAVTSFLLLIAVPMLLLLSFFGPQLFMFVFGATWEKAGTFSSWLVLNWMGRFVSAPSIAVATVLRRQKTLLLLESAFLAPRLAAIPLGAWLGNDILAIALLSISGFVPFALTTGIFLVHSYRAS